MEGNNNSYMVQQHIEGQGLLNICLPHVHLLDHEDTLSSSKYIGDMWSAQWPLVFKLHQKIIAGNIKKFSS